MFMSKEKFLDIFCLEEDIQILKKKIKSYSKQELDVIKADMLENEMEAKDIYNKLMTVC